MRTLTHITRIRPRAGVILAAASFLVALTGCQTTQTSGGPESVIYYSDPQVRKDEKPRYFDPTVVDVRDDIRQVITFWPEPVFLTKSDVPVGLRATVVFVSGETEKGAFVPGKIHVWLYVANDKKSFISSIRPVYEWQFDETAAMNWRIRRENRLGNTYGLLLTWPKDLDLEGRRVRVEIGYERLDGSVVRNHARTLDVPLGPDYRERHEARVAARGLLAPSAAVSSMNVGGDAAPAERR